MLFRPQVKLPDLMSRDMLTEIWCLIIVVHLTDCQKRIKDIRRAVSMNEHVVGAGEWRTNATGEEPDGQKRLFMFHSLGDIR